MQHFSAKHSEIVGELYRAFVLLGADNGLLGSVGSWGCDLPEADVLANLKSWNNAAVQEVKSRIQHCEMTFRRQAYSPDEAQKIAAAAL